MFFCIARDVDRFQPAAKMIVGSTRDARTIRHVGRADAAQVSVGVGNVFVWQLTACGRSEADDGADKLRKQINSKIGSWEM